jgi:RNA polymerase sigma factor (sigma-70 family)
MAAASSNHTIQVQGWLDQLRRGDESAREKLLELSCERLTRLTRKMLRRFERVRRWEQTDDVLQSALLRLHRTLAEVRPESPADYYRLAALNIRRELLDLAKHYFGPCGLGAKHATVEGKADSLGGRQEQRAAAHHDDPDQLARWTEFHEKIAGLPADVRDLFDLLWYQELKQAEVAELLGVSERTIKRRWAAARLQLHELLGGALPES